LHQALTSPTPNTDAQGLQSRLAQSSVPSSFNVLMRLLSLAQNLSRKALKKSGSVGD
jgi:hypothetical protein